MLNIQSACIILFPFRTTLMSLKRLRNSSPTCFAQILHAEWVRRKTSLRWLAHRRPAAPDGGEVIVNIDILPNTRLSVKAMYSEATIC